MFRIKMVFRSLNFYSENLPSLEEAVRYVEMLSLTYSAHAPQVAAIEEYVHDTWIVR